MTLIILYLLLILLSLITSSLLCKEGVVREIFLNEKLSRFFSMEWRPIYGLKNYEASDEGDIRNVLTGKILSSKGNVLCIPTKYCEDIAVSPRQREFLRGSYSTLKVTRGRLCCLAFHGRPEWHNFSVGFKDGDSNNCFEDNLEWRTGRNKEWRSPHD